ncbi:hypothetical protein BpHYR1_000161 [Brachionus plicatilis]|uniref:Uncharacterized protein n=1 Tax=Brachionus plicatilis TaxID=10195 RepID=A0A3M7P6H6_BRAPC|nr:hypothetical protein BpHYR1_000161 [Brachionus plicatilis]
MMRMILSVLRIPKVLSIFDYVTLSICWVIMWILTYLMSSMMNWGT